ncbi:major facilitator superfamily domain-containing protein [Armillaria luteobubalina]|uniref:Major facilitator superfamily domain-containing protein n=1 Tax=Armillaria luteobubalina TaxID=153913 RepID=A0AA39PT38_9AGAR|nr:major facilitator superfamily domain-containing protein [Armillaria luteobubalina]
MVPKTDEEWREEMSQLTYVPNSDTEKRLVRKIDIRIVPTVWILYTLSYLDHANIGNVKVGGLETALGLTSTQYSVVLLMFFVSYVVFEIPVNMILTRVRLSIYLSMLCFLWGSVASCMAAVNNWHELAGVHFSLGVIEAGFAPGVVFYLSSWYKRHELAKWYSIYYTATAVSGTFSGLLTGVITDNLAIPRGIEGWQWLFLIKGLGLCFVALFTWMILPDWPTTTKWMTAEEKFIAVERLKHDGIGGVAVGDEPMHRECLKMALTDWRVWYLSMMYMLATGSQTIQYFIPTLVGQLGYSGMSKQYMTIPVYMVALICILSFCFLSDIKKERGNFVSLTSLIAGISFIIVVAVDKKKVKSAFLCFAVGCVYAACPLTLLWVSGVIDHPAEKHTVAIALVNGLGNFASIYGTFLWPSSTGPHYVQGFATTTAFILTLCIMAQVFKVLLRKYLSQGLNYED